MATLNDLTNNNTDTKGYTKVSVGLSLEKTGSNRKITTA